ncbi:hypothetical protein DICPUDRAFT_150734 [Dictyostelium purpureum]|uniref:Ufm1-specific protease 2 n=1 Tax=Dictyostelium purpureum TaxID=5786 RepID=F0ZH42_DICPU|nr:uncharacterized protein DICPUDRAFT_150734 [Dictyostelium purpureum]EGC36727.1 hypothetical protein DICPUDRAFT_150734 [Dictyostelium purpureum]|eukprot:XP_003286752.1 hypothetical protein DICPUDRAFT_150734 [Dictyostelium purpureum]
MSCCIEYNHNLEDNDPLLNEVGYYILYGYNNTIVYSTKYNNSNINNSSHSSNNGNNLDTIVYPTVSKEFSLFGIHKTLNITSSEDTNESLNHSIITNDIKNESIQILRSILSSSETTRSYYTVSYTVIRETSEQIEKSQILFFQVFSKDLETLNQVNSTKKIEVPLIVEELNKSFYLFNYYSNSLSSISHLNSLLSSNNKNSIYFHIANNNENNPILSLNSNNLDKKIIDILSNGNTSSTPNNFGNFNKNSMNIINIELLLKITNNCNNTPPLMAPTISLNNNSNNKSMINVSSLCLISKDETVKETIELLNKSMLNQINNSVIRDNPEYNFKSIHFQFSFLPFPITTIYKTKNNNIIDDDENYNIRKQYHTTIGLPLNRPFLKSSLSINLQQQQQSLSKPSKKQQHNHIKDVHLNLSLDCKTEGNVFLVDGSYDYYHYLQDNIDDNGWGCAYRSMQTICSWLRYQNYTNKPIPTHYEIQKTLVELKDKDPSFLKSKQWIGAFEITLCLEYLFNIKCKILNISSGSEVIYKSRELAKHFQTNGSPIMIGGGVLAYTLLGIDFNESTGETRYLILDPHYTGSTENIKLIKEKGWCGWKSSDLFRKDAFYNFCQPQIPNDL